MLSYSKTFEQTSVLLPACDLSSGSVKLFSKRKCHSRPIAASFPVFVSFRNNTVRSHIYNKVAAPGSEYGCQTGRLTPKRFDFNYLLKETSERERPRIYLRSQLNGICQRIKSIALLLNPEANVFLPRREIFQEKSRRKCDPTCDV